MNNNSDRKQFINTLANLFVDMRITLVIGAGLSIPAGGQSWQELLELKKNKK